MVVTQGIIKEVHDFGIQLRDGELHLCGGKRGVIEVNNWQLGGQFVQVLHQRLLPVIFGCNSLAFEYV